MNQGDGNRLRSTLLAAGLLLTSAALLWSGITDRKEQLPEGWEPVNERLVSAIETLDEEEKAQAEETSTISSAEQSSRVTAPGGVAEIEKADKGEQANQTQAGPRDQTDQGDQTNQGDGSKESAQLDGRIDINRANAAELDQLPGIGPAKAQAIVDDRARNGAYGSVDELARVSGIGPKLLDKLRPHATAR